MNILQSVFEALESINGNKLRSGLTMLGIVIGVAAVIAMLAIGNGTKEQITSSINSMGTNLIFVMSGNRRENVTNAQQLTMKDVEALQDQVNAPSIKNVVPVISRNGVTATYSKNTISVSLNGVMPEYESMRNLTVEYGEFFTKNQLRSSVAVIGSEVLETLFPGEDGNAVIGQSIRIAGQPFTVVGILKSQGGGMMGSQDSQIILPFYTAQTRLIRRENNSLSQIIIEVNSSDVASQATSEATSILRSKHKIATGSPNDFMILSQEDMLESANQITGILTMFLGGVAGISLLVGGIGIMNIMIVSVTERTREIGLRKAIGARKRDIMLQFLTESSLLSLMGGFIGIGLGWLLSFIVGLVAEKSGMALNPVVSMDSILLSTLFSASVGLFFGMYPANRAANLQPVEALRYE